MILPRGIGGGNQSFPVFSFSWTASRHVALAVNISLYVATSRAENSFMAFRSAGLISFWRGQQDYFFSFALAIILKPYFLTVASVLRL